MYLQRFHRTAQAIRTPLRLTLGIVLGVVLGSAASWAGDTERQVWIEQGKTVIRVGVDTGICDRCEIQGRFVQQLKKLHALVEVVELKKGVGIFYTTEVDDNVDTLQEMVEEAIEGIEDINEHPEDAHLCEFCLADFPVYSKLDHELLETSRGMMLLITSDDPDAARSIKKRFRVSKSVGYREQYYGERQKEQALKDK